MKSIIIPSISHGISVGYDTCHVPVATIHVSKGVRGTRDMYKLFRYTSSGQTPFRHWGLFVVGADATFQAALVLRTCKATKIMMLPRSESN